MRVRGGIANLLQHRGRELFGHVAGKHEVVVIHVPISDFPTALMFPENDQVLLEILFREVSWQGALEIAEQDHVDPASCSAAKNSEQSSGGLFIQVDRKIGHDQEAIGLCDLACLPVVVVDGLVLVAKVGLDDLLHVFGQVEQLILDVSLFAVNAFKQSAFIRIRKMHESGKAFAEADRVQECELCLPGRNGRHQSQGVGACCCDRGIPGFRSVLDQRGDLVGETASQWQGGFRWSIPMKWCA